MKMRSLAAEALSSHRRGLEAVTPGPRLESRESREPRVHIGDDRLQRSLAARRAFWGVGYVALAGLVAFSAVLAKEARHGGPALAHVVTQPLPPVEPLALPVEGAPDVVAVNFESRNELGAPGASVNEIDVRPILPTRPTLDGQAASEGLTQAATNTVEREGSSGAVKAAAAAPAPAPEHWPPDTRWFNGRPVRPVRTMWMVVTAYSPDERSCGDSADGLTATLHSVHTNAHRLVAADPNVLPYGSMISVPGYDNASVVPVLDCGGAIKGRRLDLLFPTHAQARAFGKRKVLVTVWGYADGKPAENPRRVR